MQRDRYILAVGVPLSQTITIEVEEGTELDPLTGDISSTYLVHYTFGNLKVQRPRHDWLQVGSEFYGIIRQYGLELITSCRLSPSATEWEENKYIASSLVGRQCSGATISVDELTEIFAQVLDALGKANIDGEVVVRAVRVYE